MGILDYIPCCGSRRKEPTDNGSNAESASLLPPPRDPSIISDTPAPPAGYGSLDPTPSNGLTGEQRARIEEIGREATNQMLHIHALPNRKPSDQSRVSSSTYPTPAEDNSTAPSSRSTSRPPSPSPIRTNHDSSSLQSPGGTKEGVEGVNLEGGLEVDVVRKSLFGGSGMGTGGRRTSARGRGRGKGRGKAK